MIKNTKRKKTREENHSNTHNHNHHPHDKSKQKNIHKIKGSFVGKHKNRKSKNKHQNTPTFQEDVNTHHHHHQQQQHHRHHHQTDTVTEVHCTVCDAASKRHHQQYRKWQTSCHFVLFPDHFAPRIRKHSHVFSPGPQAEAKSINSG